MEKTPSLDPPAMSCSQRRKYQQRVAARGDYKRPLDADATEELIDIWMKWDSGRLKGIDVKNVIKDFTKDRTRDRIGLGWPTDHALVVGTPRNLNVDDYRDVLQGFPFIDKYDWCCFLGLLCTNLREERPQQDSWLLVCQTKEVYVYDRCTRRMHFVCIGIAEFLRGGMRELESFHHTEYVCRFLEEMWYGHVFDDVHVDSVSVGADIRAFNAFVERNNGLSYHTDSGVYFRMGTVTYHNLERIVPHFVLKRLRSEKYTVIGMCPEFGRIILMKEDCSVFALMSDGYVFKLADSFIAFLRMRLSALKYGKPRSILPAWEEGYETIGSQVSFGCRGNYSLPGDVELLKYWRWRSSGGLRGWPMADDV